MFGASELREEDILRLVRVPSGSCHDWLESSELLPLRAIARLRRFVPGVNRALAVLPITPPDSRVEGEPSSLPPTDESACCSGLMGWGRTCHPVCR